MVFDVKKDEESVRIYKDEGFRKVFIKQNIINRKFIDSLDFLLIKIIESYLLKFNTNPKLFSRSYV